MARSRSVTRGAFRRSAFTKHGPRFARDAVRVPRPSRGAATFLSMRRFTSCLVALVRSLLSLAYGKAELTPAITTPPSVVVSSPRRVLSSLIHDHAEARVRGKSCREHLIGGDRLRPHNDPESPHRLVLAITRRQLSAGRDPDGLIVSDPRPCAAPSRLRTP